MAAGFPTAFAVAGFPIRFAVRFTSRVRRAAERVRVALMVWLPQPTLLSPARICVAACSTLGALVQDCALSFLQFQVSSSNQNPNPEPKTLHLRLTSAISHPVNSANGEQMTENLTTATSGAPRSCDRCACCDASSYRASGKPTGSSGDCP